MQDGKKRVLIPIEKASLDAKMDFYKTQNGAIVGVDNTLLIKLKDKKYLQYYVAEYNILEWKNIFSTLYKFVLSDKSQTIDVANKLSKEEGVEYSHPNFYKKKVAR